MKILLSILIGGAAAISPGALAARASTPAPIKAYYTRLPYDDHGHTGQYADIVIELPQKGQFIFGREFGYQPYWRPIGGKRASVARLIPRQGDGPDERPDDHNIACDAAIVAQTDTSVTVHWRYAPDIATRSFTDYLAAYNQAGNPSPFYAEDADEYFTIHANGKVVRTVKQGCYSLEEWNDPRNHIEQTLQLETNGIRQISFSPAKLSAPAKTPVAGAPVKSGRTAHLVRYWSFDEGMGGVTRERLTGAACDILGVKSYWRKGVSGTCLSFDSYSSAVRLPASHGPDLKGEITVSAWIAVQECPFNLAAIVDHLDETKGYFLGLDAKGQIEFKVGDGHMVRSAITAPLPLYEWIHVAAVAKSGAGMVVYLNGKPAATVTNLAAFADAANTGLAIGMTRSLRQFPLAAERPDTKQFQTIMVFSGLIDEVKLFDQALTESEVSAEHAALKPSGGRPLNPWVLPAGPEVSPGFRAEYTNLHYSPEWDGLWRVGDFADIVVTFADKPWRYVFWRGTRYMPSLVTGYGRDGIWSNDQGPEFFDGQCYEHMSDMLCRFSKVRIIHRSDARVVVHWRNSSGSTTYQWPAKDADGWGIWTDEYWTIYPDGIAIRHQLVHNKTDKAINCELNQNEILCHPGQVIEDVLNDDAIIIANTDGETVTANRTSAQPRKRTGNWNLQRVNLKGKTKQFEIGEIGAWSEPFLDRKIWWRGWNHYPVQLIPSDGTCVVTNDRPSSSCPATFNELRHQDGNNIEAMVMYGLTDRQPAELTALNRSWNFAPEVAGLKGGQSSGYEKRERAFKFTKTNDVVAFTLRATNEQPLVNPAFVIAHWGSPDGNVSLKLNGQTKMRGADYRSGIEVDPDGSYTLVIWMPFAATESVSLEVTERK